MPSKVFLVEIILVSYAGELYNTKGYNVPSIRFIEECQLIGSLTLPGSMNSMHKLGRPNKFMILFLWELINVIRLSFNDLYLQGWVFSGKMRGVSTKAR